LPAGHDAAVRTLAGYVSDAIAATSRCRFVPALTSAVVPDRVAMIPDVVRGEIITAQLIDPLDLPGLAAVCDPLMDAIEQQLYRAYVLVDKVYVYRSLVTKQLPRASWLWHYDNHPREVLKVMIYLTDVDEASAPFEYLRGPDGQPAMGEPLAPLYGNSRLPADRYEHYRASGYEPARVTGPRGTTIIFDDNILHRATLAASADRDVVVFQIRPTTFASAPRIDRRWTGSFLHHDIHADPTDLTPRLKAVL
jgi:hypothetical protein